MSIVIESGNLLPIVSLGGVVSQPGKGRQVESQQLTVTAVVVLSPDNPKRISMIIQNITTGTDILLVYFGNAATYPFSLNPGGVLQIDRTFPFTGPILVQSVTSCVMTSLEVSVI